MVQPVYYLPVIQQNSYKPHIIISRKVYCINFKMIFVSLKIFLHDQLILSQMINPLKSEYPESCLCTITLFWWLCPAPLREVLRSPLWTLHRSFVTSLTVCVLKNVIKLQRFSKIMLKGVSLEHNVIVCAFYLDRACGQLCQIMSIVCARPSGSHATYYSSTR